MVEPTESEAKGEIDRFVTAMLAIREEIAAVERGEVAAGALAAAPARRTRSRTSWATGTGPIRARRRLLPAGRASGWTSTGRPSGRVDNAYGDRNLVCTCPPLEAYAEAAE